MTRRTQKVCFKLNANKRRFLLLQLGALVLNSALPVAVHILARAPHPHSLKQKGK